MTAVTAPAQPKMTLPTVALRPTWRDPEAAVLAGLAWGAGWALVAPVAVIGWLAYMAATGQPTKDAPAAGWVAGLIGLALAGVAFAAVAPVVVSVLNRFTLRPPQWGTPEAQDVPAGRWGLSRDYLTSARVEIEAHYDLTVIRAERENRWVVEDRDGTIRIGTLVLLGKPGPDGQQAVLTYEGLPAAVASS